MSEGAAKHAPADARSDRDLVHAARAGDALAFDALFYRHRDGIYRLGLAITHDPSAAEEIVIDAFARAHRALARLEPDDSLRPWLYRVAVNLSYDRRPRPNVVVGTLDDAAEEVLESGDGSPASLAELAELRHEVLAAVDRLDPKHRTVVILHHLNGMSLSEIAQVVEVPVGTVKSRLHYGLRRLRAHLDAHPELGFEPARRPRPTPGGMPLPAVERARRPLEE